MATVPPASEYSDISAHATQQENAFPLLRSVNDSTQPPPPASYPASSSYPPLLRSVHDNGQPPEPTYHPISRTGSGGGFETTWRSFFFGVFLPFFSLQVGKYNILATLFWTGLLAALTFFMFVFGYPRWGLAMGTFTILLLCNWVILKCARQFGEDFLRHSTPATLKDATTNVLICIAVLGGLLCTITSPLILQAGGLDHGRRSHLLVVESAITAWAAVICSFLTTLWSVLMLLHLMPMSEAIAAKFVKMHGWMIGFPALYCMEGVLWMFLSYILLTYEYHDAPVATVGGLTACSFLVISITVGGTLRNWKPE